MKRVFMTLTIAALATTTACSSSSKGGGPLNLGGSSTGTNGTSTSTSHGGGGGGGGGGDYCGVIRSAKTNIEELKNMSGGSTTTVSFGIILNAINSATASAPSDIKPSWLVLQQAFTTFVNALRSAGVDPNHLTDISKLSPTQLQALESVSQQLDSAQVTAATDKIDANVKAKCGVDLGS